MGTARDGGYNGPVKSPARLFLRQDGSFRFLVADEFAKLSTEEKSEYLALASKELSKSAADLRELIARRDAETDN